MKIFSSKALGLGAMTALIVLGGGLKPACAEWTLREGTQTDVNLQVPTVTASVSNGGLQDHDGPYQVAGTGASTAGATFDWVPDARATPDDHVTILHNMSVGGSVDSTINVGMGGAGYARADIFANQYDNFVEKYITYRVETNSSIFLSQNAQSSNHYFYVGPNGVVTRTITPNFTANLSNRAEVNVGSYQNADGNIVNMNGATATAYASSLQTTGISVQP